MPGAAAQSIPVSRDAVSAARRAVTEFTGRGLSAPALLEVLAHAEPGQRISAVDVGGSGAAAGVSTGPVGDTAAAS